MENTVEASISAMANDFCSVNEKPTENTIDGILLISSHGRWASSA